MKRPINLIPPLLFSSITRQFSSKQSEKVVKDVTKKIRAPSIFSPRNVEPLSTIQDVYRFAVSQFNHHCLEYGHSTLNAYEDASFLILHELSLPGDSNIQNWFDAKLTVREKTHLVDLIKQRCLRRIPTPYLVKGCYQQGVYFYVDERVLIPRSFIGELLRKWSEEQKQRQLEAANSKLKLELDYEDYFGHKLDPLVPEAEQAQLGAREREISAENVRSVLDLCTGSGCLAVLSCRLLPNVVSVHATDISADALEVAHMNVQSHGLEDRISLFAGDLFHPLPPLSSYDLILCNPPYVSAEDMQELSEECRREPGGALFGGKDGLDLVEEVLRGARDRLTAEGVLVCEIGRNAEAMERRFGDMFSRGEGGDGDRVRWLGTEQSSHEVFLITRQQLHTLFPSSS